jgi:hypothetical protein
MRWFTGLSLFLVVLFVGTFSSRAAFGDDPILLRAGPLDTTERELSEQTSGHLHIVQLSTPPTPEVIQMIRSAGARIVSYIPKNAYLVWAEPGSVDRLRGLSFIKWDGPFRSAYKLDPSIKLIGSKKLVVSVRFFGDPQVPLRIEGLSDRVLMRESDSMKVVIDRSRLMALLEIPQVIFVAPWPEIKLLDERANQIVAGQAGRPGYADFLRGLGQLDLSFAVDIGDTGLDRGSLDQIHPDFFDSAGNPVVAYLNDFTSDPHPNPSHDISGHGTFNASVLAGASNRRESPFVDADGFRRGLGVAPLVRLGVSKLFGDDGSFRAQSFEQFIRQAYLGGARIGSYSWGACDAQIGFCNFYSDDSATFDRLVRDADPIAIGNQGMVLVFASGNSGLFSPASVSIPGTAKNVITVGASESLLPVGPDGSPLVDGCGLGSADADDFFEVARFSSGGPLYDGRIKPDLVAPGTHIQGAASQDPGFSAEGVCAVPGSNYFPPDQRLYTISSGTSHSTPIVAGGAALVYAWLSRHLGHEPSPALVKAFLLNSTRYIGVGDLPGPRQGWGLMDLGRAFEQVDRIIYDQDPSRLFTRSGGEPFQVTGVISDPTKEFRVMLVWTDAPGNPITNAPYVNQLNLEVIVGGVLYRGNNFSGQYSVPGGREDFLNNVQGVRLPPGTAGPFVVRVKPTIIAGDGVPENGFDLDQDFALVITNGRQVPAPVLSVQGAVVLHADSTLTDSLIPGEEALLRITLRNESSVASGAIQAELVLGQSRSTSLFPSIEPGGLATNQQPFRLSVPLNLRCGATVDMTLLLETELGRVSLPVRLTVGRGQSDLLLFEDGAEGKLRWKLRGFTVSSAYASSGLSSYHAVDPGKQFDDAFLAMLLQKKPISIPANAGHVRLSFWHIFDFEPGYDGGVLEISTDGGQTWQDLGSKMILGGYDGRLTSASRNPLGDRFAWTSRGARGAFSRVLVDLDEFAGQTIRLRFLAGFDEATGIIDGYTGWFIDDIKITASLFSCQADAEFETRDKAGALWYDGLRRQVRGRKPPID